MFQTSRDGFTLVEILIVVAIIGILAGLVIGIIKPDLQRNRAAEVANAESIRKVATAVEAYRSARGDYPDECNEGNLCHGYLQSWPEVQGTNQNPTEQYKFTYSKGECGPDTVLISTRSQLDPDRFLIYNTGAQCSNLPLGKVVSCVPGVPYNCSEEIL